MSTEEMDFETELNAEVSRRLAIMQEPGYEFPVRMKKIDWIVAGIIMVVSIAIVEFATLSTGVM
ncbi:MAG: hypothetical protein Q4D34_03850 [Eggerthellaceae bacterium]|nr:hypothetical protein [Eggerthellaceae bacterium]